MEPMSAKFRPLCIVLEKRLPDLRRLCLVLAWISLFCAIVGPLMSVLPAIFPETSKWTHGAISLAWNLDADWNKAASWQRFGATVCTLVSDVPLSVALVYMFRLFRCYAVAEAFSARAVRLLDHMARWFLLSRILDFFMLMLSSALLSYHPISGGDHEFTSKFGLNTESFTLLFAALCALVIARVLREAQHLTEENTRLAEENESFV